LQIEILGKTNGSVRLEGVDTTEIRKISGCSAQTNSKGFGALKAKVNFNVEMLTWNTNGLIK